MKTQKDINFIILLIGIILATSCSVDYFNPESFSPNRNANVSTYDFLKSQPDVFNLFVQIIDKTNYKDSVNIKNATVIAANNESVLSYLRAKNINAVAAADSSELNMLIGKYVFRKNLSSANVNSIPHTERSVVNYPLTFSLRQDKWKGVEGVGPLVIFISDAKDPKSERDDVLVKVATSDIKTTSGIVLALSSDHVFGF